MSQGSWGARAAAPSHHASSVPAPSAKQSSVRSEPSASGPCHPLRPPPLEVWGKEPENWVPTCRRKAPDEIGKAAATASSPSLQASSCWPPDSARCASRAKSCLRAYGTPRAQQQVLGRRGASPPPRDFPPQAPSMRLAGGMDGQTDRLGVAPPSQGREEARGSLSPRRVAAKDALPASGIWV